MCPVTCPCFTITGLQTKFDFSSPFFVVDTWNLAAMLPISHFLFFSPLFLLLSAFSYSTCHFCMPLPSLTAPSFLPPPHSPCFTSWTHPSFIPRVSLSLSPFLPLTQLPTTCLHSIISDLLYLTFSAGGDLQTSCGTLDEGGLDDNIDWEEEREMERLACEGDDFIPPKIMVRDP